MPSSILALIAVFSRSFQAASFGAPAVSALSRGAPRIVHYDPWGVLSKVLVISLIGLVIGKLFFGVRLRAIAKGLDRLINACIIAIAIVYSIQLLLYFVYRH